jgi:hypothetical protein
MRKAKRSYAITGWREGLPPRHDRGRADDSHAATAGVSPSRAGSLPWRAAASLRAAARAGTAPASPPDAAISAGPGAIHQGRAARPAPATPTRLTPRRRGRADVTDERLADQRVRARCSRDRRLTARHVVLTSSAGGVLPRRDRLESMTSPTKIESAASPPPGSWPARHRPMACHHPRVGIEHDHMRGLADVSAHDCPPADKPVASGRHWMSG